jgi:hypothetical protein
LVERLNQGAQRKLTLVSAPAGSGKSTLVAEWVAASRRAAAWISLDPGDNNPALFWTYVVTALRTARPDVGESALSWLSSARPPATEWILTSLINEITANDQHVDPARRRLSARASPAADAPGDRHPVGSALAPGPPQGTPRADGATGL